MCYYRALKLLEHLPLQERLTAAQVQRILRDAGHESEDDDVEQARERYACICNQNSRCPGRVMLFTL